jgi:sugar/nucleoside kinase (ribokinase family)
MTSESPLLDLLVIGGMTIDQFADGSAAAGGTVMHAARAAASRGLRIGIVTATGTEPEALAGLSELRGLAPLVESRRHAWTTTFRHREGPTGRRLWLDHLGGSVELDATARDRVVARAVLCAPVAGEVTIDALAAWPDISTRAATLQGWLRTTDEGVEVRPLPLSAMSRQFIEALSRFDLLVASREDLLAEAEAPPDQLSALRRAFGERPTMVVTDGADGLWLDMPPAGSFPGLRRHVAVPWRVEGASTVGAGDILAAFLTMSCRETASSSHRWVLDAMRVVAEILDERKPAAG